MDGAAQVFETHGYAAGTTNRIAERAGVSIGTLYQYFPSKEAVAVALLERHIADTDAHLREWVGHLGSEQHGLEAAMRDYVTGMLEMHASKPRLQHILLEETPLPQHVHQALLDGERQAAQTMTELLRRFPEVRHAHLERAGFLVVQCVESLTHRFAVHPYEQIVMRQPFIDEMVLMLCAYLTGEKQPEESALESRG